MYGTGRDGDAPPEPADDPTFPTLSTSLSLRHVTAYRSQDDEGEPILIITDGVSTIALESGLASPSSELVVAARRLAATAEDFAAVLAEQIPDAKELQTGRRPVNRRYVPGPRNGTR
jgi:hypothetical protein